MGCALGPDDGVADAEAVGLAEGDDAFADGEEPTDALGGLAEGRFEGDRNTIPTRLATNAATRRAATASRPLLLMMAGNRDRRISQPLIEMRTPTHEVLHSQPVENTAEGTSRLPFERLTRVL